MPFYNTVHLEGKIFGRWVVLRRGTRKGGYWLCRCSCPKKTEKEVNGRGLQKGTSTSCGCLCEEHPNSRTHGKSKTRQYGLWCGLLSRCYNPNSPAYANYGGRRITVCDRWREPETGFQNFLEDVGSRPEGRNEKSGKRPKFTLDRIDNNGNYEPSNCQWSTWSHQAKNQRKRCAIQNYSENEFLTEASRRGYELQDCVLEYGMSGC